MSNSMEPLNKPATGPKWTDDQLTAITARDCNLLVAAAAGAGKTAVLVERIIRRITDEQNPLDVDRLLVVTFTKAAAAEMRERISAAINRELNGKPFSKVLHRQLNLMNRASITTLHSFCMDIVKRYFYRLEIDPTFRVADDNEAALLRLDALEDLFEEKYSSGDADFLALVDAYGGNRDDAELKDIVLNLYEFSTSHPWPRQWLADLPAAYLVSVTEDENLGSQCQTPGDNFPDRALPSATPPAIDDLPWAKSLLESFSLQLEGARRKLVKALGLAATPGGPAAYTANLQDDITLLDDYITASARTWDELYRALNEQDFGKLNPCRGKDIDDNLKDRVKKLRDDAKKKVASLRTKLFSRPPAEMLADLAKMAPMIAALSQLVIDFAETYHRAKEAKALVDFADLEHCCLQILLDPEAEPGEVKPSPVALELREYFGEILVDEYQDINAVQETILRLLSRQGEDNPNLFMVGDVKQSIYRFRQAEPTLFLGKYRSFPRAEGERDRGVDLACNFRSRQEVVDAVNFIFRQIMTPRVGEMAYDKLAELVCGASYPPAPDGVNIAAGPAELHLLEKNVELDHGASENGDRSQDTAFEAESTYGQAKSPSGDAAGTSEESDPTADLLVELADLDAVQREARLVARRIREMVGDEGNPSEFCVFDKNLGYRPVRYRDIVVLMRATKGSANTFLEEFRLAGIPAYADLGTGYFAATEVETVMSLLKIIDNPRQDIPLAAVLRSPIVGLNAQDLAQIKLHAPKGDFYDAVLAAAQANDDAAPAEDDVNPATAHTLAPRLRDFLSKLDQWRTRARQGSLADLIWTLYRETGFYDYAGGLPEGAQRQANLRALYDRARQYEATTFRGLFRFLRFIERFQETGSDLGSARALGESEDVVRVMSIHKSKGLEFPVVILAGLGKEFNRMDLRKKALLHKELGLGLPVVDTELRLTYPSLAQIAITRRLEMELLAEELRILYVAMTRAKEKLILVGSVRELSKMSSRWSENVTQPGWPLPDCDLASAKTFLDWLCPAIARHADGEPLRKLAVTEGSPDEPTQLPIGPVPNDNSRWQVHLCKPEDCALSLEENAVDYASLLEQVQQFAPVEIASDLTDEITRRLSWQYPFAPVVGRAAKASVSELKRRFAQLEAEEGEAEAAIPATAATPTSIPVPTRPQMERPRFLRETTALSGAEIGTATHLVMQHLDFSGDLTLSGIKAQIEAMAAKNLLTKEQAEAVNMEAVSRFFDTPLGKKALAAERVLRELPFTMALPAQEVYPELASGTADVHQSPADCAEQVLVQGVIDCLLDQKDGFILIDYKTDRVGPGGAEEIVQRYRGQMDLYARAVESILGKPVTEKWLYLFSLGVAVQV